MNLPDEMDEDLAEILGRPNFLCGAIARIMVASGEVAVRPKAEAEQAIVIHKLLGFYAAHGARWRKAAADWLDAMQERAKARAGEPAA